MSNTSNCHTLPIVSTRMIATSCFVTMVNSYMKRRRSCDTDRRPAAAYDACLAGVTAWQSGERGSQTVGGAEAGLSESLPGSLYSLVVATHSAVRTPVMGKF